PGAIGQQKRSCSAPHFTTGRLSASNLTSGKKATSSPEAAKLHYPRLRPSGLGRIFAETFRHRLISSVNSLLFSVQTQLILQGKSASKGRWIPTPATSAATSRPRAPH